MFLKKHFFKILQKFWNFLPLQIKYRCASWIVVNHVQLNLLSRLTIVIDHEVANEKNTTQQGHNQFFDYWTEHWIN